MAVDVSAVVADISAQSGPIFAVGLIVVLVYVGIRLYRWVFAAIGVVSPSVAPSSRDVAFFDTAQTLAKEDRKAAEFYVAAADHGGVAGYVQHMDAVEAGYQRMWAAQASAPASSAVSEYERLADVWQGWTDQVASAKASGGVAPAASQSLGLYDALVQRGMDPAAAIAAVEARNGAVLASAAREEASVAESVDDAPSFDGFAVYEAAVSGGASHDDAMRARDAAFRDFQDARLGL